jgi:hypothetical protein
MDEIARRMEVRLPRVRIGTSPLAYVIQIVNTKTHLRRTTVIFGRPEVETKTVDSGPRENISSVSFIFLVSPI